VDLIGQELGPYRVESELGSGGMGKVYRAAGPDGPVAIKVVHSHLLETSGFFERFLREAQIGRTVCHRNVVRTLDCDTVAGHHFLVMEFVEGRSLRELLDDLGTVPETLLREIAVQTATGLCAIHGAGIVHRDLKPENVLITEDHDIRIMDLGVAKLAEATISITREGQFAGSLLYAAPEQFGPDAVGPSVDLYSLGVMLHELATGSNPFRRDDAAAVIDAQLKHKAPRVSDLNGEVSEFLSECIDTLLAKRPAERFESAEQLRAVLEQGEHSEWWTGLAPKRRRHLPQIRVRRETKLHGRERDLALLSEAFERAKGSEGNTVYIEGEAGIGKTRLVDAFLAGLDEPNGNVLYGSYPPSGGLGAISDAVLQHFGESDTERSLAPYLKTTPSLVPAFAALLKHEGPPTGVERLGGSALQSICVQLMHALAEESPLVWVVEDLHFAPQESRAGVLALARAAEGHRVLVVVTARPGVPEPELAHFSRLENFQRAALPRLGGREIIELLEDAFQSEALAERLGGKITRKSDGVPLFIFEMVRGLEEGHFIQQREDGSYEQTQVIDDIEVPSAVRDLIEARLRGLTEDQRAIVDVGAVQGMSFEPALIAEVLERKKVAVLQQIAAIERRFGLVKGEATSCVFDQDQIQEVLYGDLLPELRSEYHTLLADAHAKRCGPRLSGSDAVFLTRHHLLGSRPADALPHLDRALDHLENGYRNEIAISLARRVLELPDLVGGKERVEVLLRLARRLDLLGRRDEERAALDEAIALAEEDGDLALRARARQSLGSLQFALSERDAAQQTQLEVLRLADAAGERKLAANATGSLGVIFHSLGRYTDAREHHERHRAISRELGDRRGEMRANGNLGNVFWSEGDYPEARAHYERCLSIAQEIGDRQAEARATGNIGMVLYSVGRYAEAREHYDRGHALGREIGDRQGEAIAIGNIGIIYQSLSRYEEAKACYERQRAVSREVGDRRAAANATAHLGGVFWSLGRLSESRECNEHYLEVSREIGDRRGEGFALQRLAELAAAQHDLEEATRLGEQALARRRELGEHSTAAETLAFLGGLDAERGDSAGSVARLDEALALARKVGSPEAILAATVERARRTATGVEVALEALAEHEECVSYSERMYARFRLWELTRDPVHLAEAHRLLEHARAHAPDDDRDSMIRNVPLYRDITRAWEGQRTA
jgi:tetratricopeptide (TPR) repeat protein/predicted Ser/Thr protein kinase